jgi:hypothetical protein
MSRGLSSTERAEAELVFEGSLDLDRIRVYEGARWPLWVAQAGARLASETSPENNAITLGRRAFFSRELSTGAADIQAGHLTDMGWLIHELTHAWQYEQAGILYLWQALKVQIQLGEEAYDYGGPGELLQAQAEGKPFDEFNREQQGDIARDYFFARKRGEDTSPWLPFIHELRAA